ncbi:MAG: carbohydrate ABC transporter permease [Acetobacteraceae bacterium]
MSRQASVPIILHRAADGLLMKCAAGLIALIVLGPLVWGLSTSLKTEVMAVHVPPEIIPWSLTFHNYLRAFQDQTFLTDLGNSVLYALGGVLVAFAVGIPAGYAAARFNFPQKRAIMLGILATSMVPSVALLVPTYYVLDALGLLNNRPVIVFLEAARIVPQTVWFLQGFIAAIPLEIEEAALTDGASRPGVVRHLVLPLIKPGLAAVAMIDIVTIWNDYITVAVFAPDIRTSTLQVALVNQVFDSTGISWSYMMAFAIISSLPVMFLFALVQKWFVAGLTAGAVKG